MKGKCNYHNFLMDFRNKHQNTYLERFRKNDYSILPVGTIKIKLYFQKIYKNMFIEVFIQYL